MTDGEALLRTILERPTDDTARLVYADWLQENGNEFRATRRAQFIRAGVRLGPTFKWCYGDGPGDSGSDERELFDFVGDGIWSGLSQIMGNDYFASTRWVTICRGFVAEIRLPLAAFMEHAPALFRTHPIERVTLTGLNPIETLNSVNPSYGWASHQLGRKLIEAVAADFRCRVHRGPASAIDYAGFASVADALDALSARCVAYGRSLAGLPALVSA